MPEESWKKKKQSERQDVFFLQLKKHALVKSIVLSLFTL